MSHAALEEWYCGRGGREGIIEVGMKVVLDMKEDTKTGSDLQGRPWPRTASGAHIVDLSLS